MRRVGLLLLLALVHGPNELGRMVDIRWNFRAGLLGAHQPPVGPLQQRSPAVARQHRGRQAAVRSAAAAAARRQAQDKRLAAQHGPVAHAARRPGLQAPRQHLGRAAGVPLPAAGGLHPLRHPRRPGLRAPRRRPGLPRRAAAVRLQRRAVPQHVRGAAQVAGHRGHLPHAADRGDAEPGAAAHHVGVQQSASPRSDHAHPPPVGARAAARHQPLHDLRGQHHAPGLLGDHRLDPAQQAHLHHQAGAVFAAQADAGLPRDPQGPPRQQRPAAAAAAPPHRADQHRLLPRAGEKLSEHVQRHALPSDYLGRQRDLVESLRIPQMPFVEHRQSNDTYQYFLPTEKNCCSRKHIVVYFWTLVVEWSV